MLNDSPIILFINKMADLFLLNILFIVCCIPIVTIGPALSALYSVSLRSIRYGDGYVVKGFFKAFKNNFRQSIVVWILLILSGIVLALDVVFWMHADFDMLSKIMLAVSSALGYFIFIVALWLFPVLSKIENKLWVNVKNAAALALGHFFPYTFILTVMTFVFFYLVSSSLIMDVLTALFGFSLLAYIQSFFFYKVLAKYLKEEPIGENDLLYGNKEQEF